MQIQYDALALSALKSLFGEGQNSPSSPGSAGQFLPQTSGASSSTSTSPSQSTPSSQFSSLALNFLTMLQASDPAAPSAATGQSSSSAAPPVTTASAAAASVSASNLSLSQDVSGLTSALNAFSRDIGADLSAVGGGSNSSAVNAATSTAQAASGAAPIAQTLNARTPSI